MERINIRKTGKWLEVLNDAAAITLGFAFIKTLFNLPKTTAVIYAVFLPVAMGTLFVLDAYGGRSSYTTQKKRVFITIGVGVVISAFVSLFISLFMGNINKLLVHQYAVFYGACYVLMTAGRSAIFAWIIYLRKKQSILIIYSDGCPVSFLKKLGRNAVDFGKVSFLKLSEDDFEEKVADTINENDNLLIVGNVSEKIRDKYIIYAFKRGKNIELVPTVENLAFLGGKVIHMGDTPLIELRNDHGHSLENFVKRVFDLFAAIIGLILLSPIFLLCAVLIKLDSEGPVFYTQERYTLHKKRFKIIKFRTMVADAEKRGARLTTENDDRITRFGKILRACRLDELPQLVNIIKGEMSFVGPRPERPVYADRYSKMVKNYDVRYVAKAGLTGYAQIYGQYNTKVSDKVLFDSIYINNFSVWLDLKLIVQTVMIMFVKESTEGVAEEMADVPGEKQADDIEAEKV